MLTRRPFQVCVGLVEGEQESSALDRVDSAGGGVSETICVGTANGEIALRKDEGRDEVAYFLRLR